MARCPLQAKLAEKELRGKPLEDLTWHTPEGIAIKPVYTQDDLEGHVAELPGQFPFTRGPKATMYVATPPLPPHPLRFLNQLSRTTDWRTTDRRTTDWRHSAPALIRGTKQHLESAAGQTLIYVDDCAPY